MWHELSGTTWKLWLDPGVAVLNLSAGLARAHSRSECSRVLSTFEGGRDCGVVKDHRILAGFDG